MIVIKQVKLDFLPFDSVVIFLNMADFAETKAIANIGVSDEFLHRC